MAKPQRRFTQDFRDEAVRLAETSGRSRHEIARDLGIGLSTLRPWIDRRRERRIEQPPQDRQEDMAAEVKRLRRENEILRQERDTLQQGEGWLYLALKLFARRVDGWPVAALGMLAGYCGYGRR